jgi:hypothetical protein
VVLEGLTVIEFVVCPPGDQLNEPPLGVAVAVSVTLDPGQNVTGETLTLGLGATVTVPVALADAQPLSV